MRPMRNSNGQQLKDTRFDLIVDDGLHRFEANAKFLSHSHHKLADDGYYIIEDIAADEGQFRQV